MSSSLRAGALERTGFRVSVLWCCAWVLACTAVASSAVDAQEPDPEIRAEALRVFLDCNTFQCDSDYFRTEVGFVNWVRDRTLAQVHLIITSSQTGGGGNVFALDFVGLQGLEGRDDQLSLTTFATDTESEELDGLTRVMAAGLARYSALIGQTSGFEISTLAAALTGTLVSADQVDDPWNFWVFELSANIDLEGEKSEKRREHSGRLEASRTTDAWKMEFDLDGEFSREEQELEDGEIVIDDRTNWNANVLLAYALRERWSLGVLAGAGASTRRNQQLGADASAAIEYSFLPYEDAPRRSLTFSYGVGLRYFDWEEETIYLQVSELRPQHELRLQLFQRQPWGESRVSLTGSQFLHDTNFWSVSLSSDVEFRIVRGLSLEVEADVELIEDQLFISRAGLTDQDILLGRFQRPTNYTYEISVGLSFEFGSIYNNVVNNRFDRRRGGNGGF